MHAMVTFLSLTLSLFANARMGDWSSGGGEILRTSQNPWFLANSKTISYCIEADPANFSDLPTPLATQIELAWQYWQLQFASARPPEWIGDPSLLQMATQKLVHLSACNSQADIAFYFGERPPKIETFVQDFSSFVGVAVRTEYDEVQLRGRGFIYVAADRGPNAYSGEYLRHGAWHLGQGGLLYRILVHEWGHVFGLPHILESLVMNDHWAERVLSPLSSDLNLWYPMFEGVRFDGVVDERCFSRLSNKPFLEVFTIPASITDQFCYRLSLSLTSGLGQVTYSRTPTGEQILLGTITQIRQQISSVGGISIWLPAGQQVFVNRAPYSTLTGIQALRREVTGTFHSVLNSSDHEIFFNLTPLNWNGAGATVGGVIDGKVIFDLLQ